MSDFIITPFRPYLPTCNYILLLKSFNLGSNFSDTFSKRSEKRYLLASYIRTQTLNHIRTYYLWGRKSNVIWQLMRVNFQGLKEYTRDWGKKRLNISFEYILKYNTGKKMLLKINIYTFVPVLNNWRKKWSKQRNITLDD